MKVLESDRLILRTIERKDLLFMLELRNDKRICEWIIHEPMTFESQVKWFENLNNALYFCIELKTGERIGIIGLFEISSKHQRAKWTLKIHPDYWRKGYGKETIKLFLNYVFNTMNINKIWGDCFTENIAEVNNLQKLGFREEGIWNDHYFHKGKFRTAINFAMTRGEYNENN